MPEGGEGICVSESQRRLLHSEPVSDPLKPAGVLLVATLKGLSLHRGFSGSVWSGQGSGAPAQGARLEHE